MTEQEIRAIDCMTRHLQGFLEQSGEQRTADFAEPCGECRYFKERECECNWIETMKPVIQHGTETITVMKPCKAKGIKTKALHISFEDDGKSYMVLIQLIEHKREFGIGRVEVFRRSRDHLDLEAVQRVEAEVCIERSQIGEG